MDLLSQIVARAKSNKQRIVLPEAEEERTLCAADKALADDIADIILIGNPAKVEALAKEKGLKTLVRLLLLIRRITRRVRNWQRNWPRSESRRV